MPERPMRHRWLPNVIAAVIFILGAIVVYTIVEWLGFR
jgi:hypothetical protein